MCAICDAAWQKFEEWLATQSDDVQGMDITEQISLYALTSSERLGAEFERIYDDNAETLYEE